MRMICCSVCKNKYNEAKRRPLLLQCGHGFCRECLSKMFASSPDCSLPCPRCRHVSTVGNSVSALKKNYAVLSMIRAGNDDDADSEAGDDYKSFITANNNHNANNSGSGGCVYSNVVRTADNGFRVGRIDLGVHMDVKVGKKIGDGSNRRPGVEMWAAVVSGRGCKHKVAVKKVAIGEDMDVAWMQGQLEELKRKSMWCRNVCTFHGATRMDDSLCLVMDKCHGSVQTAMQRNEGRLTLEQILRYGADIARGVAELHAAGVVCMNIKPSNLLLDGKGHAVVSDYGLPAILKKPDCWKAGKECALSKIHSCMDCTMLSPNYTAPEAWEPVKKSLHLFWDDAIGIS